MELFGHENAKALLRRVQAHTFLFTGPEKVGRRQAAKWFAALLNCESQALEPCGVCPSCRLFETPDHPDYREIQADMTTTTGRSNRRPEIRISQLVPRQGSADLALSQWLEARASFKTKVAVIDGAHLLNLSAANAFLKTLEEPPNHTRIILIAPSQQAVLPTIASRASIINFSPSQPTHVSANPLARLGRFGDKLNEEHDHPSYVLSDHVESYIKGLKSNLEDAFEAADALEKTWESSPDASDLLLARLSQETPHIYQQASQALESFDEALSSYSSSHLAMQVLTLELRSLLTKS
jgi:hypothetical protein